MASGPEDFMQARARWEAMLARLRALLARLKGRRPALPPPRGAVPARRGEPYLKSVREGFREGGRHVTLNREVVRSRPELRIANFLFRRGVRYEYERPLEGATPDFYLPDSNIIVEHWGMDHSKYRERRAAKRRMYESRGYVVVETERADVPKLELVLEARLLRADPHVFERRRQGGGPEG